MQTWDKIWINVARDVALKSPDFNTKVGAVIVDKQHHIKSVGFNGFMRQIDDEVLPRTRDKVVISHQHLTVTTDKYPWMIHAEINAILACEHRPIDCVLYCTHLPCLQCYQFIANSGITEIVYPRNTVVQMCNNKEAQQMLELAQLLTSHYLTVRTIE